MHPLWLVYFITDLQRWSLWLLTQWKVCIFMSIEIHNSWFEAHLKEKKKTSIKLKPNTFHLSAWPKVSMQFFVFSHCDSWYTVILCGPLDIIKHHTRQDKNLSYLPHVVLSSWLHMKQFQFALLMRHLFLRFFFDRQPRTTLYMLSHVTDCILIGYKWDSLAESRMDFWFTEWWEI